MTPLAPLYLLGMAAAGIPLVLHLIYRRRAQKLPFPSIRFLRMSHERTAHRRRIQNLLLLLLRTLLLLLLALGLAQFVVQLAEGSGRGTVAIVVDNSYSMAAVHEGNQRFARAKEAAFAILRELDPNDEVLLLFTSGPERRLESEFTRDKQAVHNAVNRSVCSAQGGNVMQVLREARDRLVKRDAPLKQMYVLTDGQKRAWETPAKWDAEAETALERAAWSRIPVTVYYAGRPVGGNLAVRDVRVSGQAFVKGAPVTIDADVANPSPEPAEVIVELRVGSEPKGKRKLGVGPNGTATASFAYELPDAGVAGVEVRLPDDPLDVDNRRVVKLEVKENIRALIVQDAASAVDFLDQSYFLERALDPSIALGGESVSIIRPDRLLLANLERAPLSDYDVAFLLNVRSASAAAAAALAAFVRRGGGLIVFAGEDLDAGAYRRLFGRGEEPLLPLPLRPVAVAAPDRSRFTRVTSVDDAHPVFAPFRGLNVFRPVRIYKSGRIDLHASTPMVTLARLADGQPLVLEHSAGKGKVVFIAVTADASWSNLPVTDVFLPMIHQIVYHVCGSFEETDSLAVGAPYRFSFPETAATVHVDVRRPDGVEETVSSSPTADTNAVVYTHTFRPGYYAYATRGGVTRRGAFVVNPNTAESDLRPIEEDALEDHLRPANVRICSTADAVRKRVTELREPRRLQDLFILAAVVVAVFETVISNWTVPKGEEGRAPAPAPAEEGAE
jgi:hypothetical protein